MGLAFFISEAAEADIYEAYNWYFEKNNELGRQFEFQIKETIKNIQQRPENFQLRYSRIHVCFAKQFPYGIHYYFDETRIIVVAVFHTSRNPKVWKSRRNPE